MSTCQVDWFELCDPMMNNARAFYQHALMWYFTRDSRHAEKVIELMDVWGRNFKSITGRNRFIQAGWTGMMMTQGADIVKHSYSGWDTAVESRFDQMLRNVYLPLSGGDGYGNHKSSATLTHIMISIFLDDVVEFNKAMKQWKIQWPLQFDSSGKKR